MLLVHNEFPYIFSFSFHLGCGELRPQYFHLDFNGFHWNSNHSCSRTCHTIAISKRLALCTAISHLAAATAYNWVPFANLKNDFRLTFQQHFATLKPNHIGYASRSCVKFIYTLQMNISHSYFAFQSRFVRFCFVLLLLFLFLVVVWNPWTPNECHPTARRFRSAIAVSIWICADWKQCLRTLEFSNRNVSFYKQN